MKKVLLRGCTGQRGAAMVEFAIVALVFFTLVIGLVDFGLGIFYYNQISNAAREGARYGVIDSRTANQICDYTLSKVVLPDVTGLDPINPDPCGTYGRLTVAVTDGTRRVMALDANGLPFEQTPSNPVVVTLTYNYEPATPLVQGLVGPVLTLKAESSMYIED